MKLSIEPKFDLNGLIPAVIQDSQTKAVLMVAWMNQEAFDLTRKTRQVHFWSRSRQEIWRKGATSGNTLSLIDMWIDCDADTLLLQVNPAGPVCHTGNTACFYREIK
jgi:phosphoribosyl-AMP cyclohydrolase